MKLHEMRDLLKTAVDKLNEVYEPVHKASAEHVQAHARVLRELRRNGMERRILDWDVCVELAVGHTEDEVKEIVTDLGIPYEPRDSAGAIWVSVGRCQRDALEVRLEKIGSHIMLCGRRQATTVLD